MDRRIGPYAPPPYFVPRPHSYVIRDAYGGYSQRSTLKQAMDFVGEMETIGDNGPLLQNYEIVEHRNNKSEEIAFFPQGDTFEENRRWNLELYKEDWWTT